MFLEGHTGDGQPKRTCMLKGGAKPSDWTTKPLPNAPKNAKGAKAGGGGYFETRGYCRGGPRWGELGKAAAGHASFNGEVSADGGNASRRHGGQLPVSTVVLST